MMNYLKQYFFKKVNNLKKYIFEYIFEYLKKNFIDEYDYEYLDFL